MSSTNALDYFATLGKKGDQVTCNGIPNIFGDERGDLLTPNQVLSMGITDIVVVAKEDEDVGPGWEILGSTVGGTDLEFPQIAVRRWNTLKRRDYICDVIVCRREDALPLGYNRIDVSLSGQFDGAIRYNEDKTVAFHLAIRRFNTVTKTSFLNGDSFLDDICILDPDDELPENYAKVKQITSSSMPGFSRDSNQMKMAIGVHRHSPLGICDISYEYATIDRYPAKDLKKGLELPINELPMFAFPQGLKLVYNKKQDYPLPTYFTFVFTDVKGDHLYAACLKLYERVEPSEIQKVLFDIYGPTNQDDKPWNFNAVFQDIDIFVPKIICVISRFPFYRAMKCFLKEMYKLSLSSSICPIEHFIASIVNQLPLPIPGGRPYHVVLDAALISATSQGMPPCVFKLPSSKIFPLMDIEFSSPFKCLTIDNITAIFCLMLREAKIVFLCTSNSILTETMEILQSLLFPLTWSCSFISRLPDAVAGMMQAPGGFMIGIQSTAPIEGRPVVNNYQDTPSWKKTITPGTYVVDLNKNSISQFNGTNEELLSNSKIQQIYKTLPNGPRLRLIYRLQRCIEEYGIRPAGSNLEKFDSVFDFQFDMEAKTPKQFPSYEVRDAFLVFMADILGEYHKYIKPPPRDLGQDTFRTFREAFEVDNYINDCDASIRSLITGITETQMFSVLLQQRSEGGFYGLDMFDRATRVLKYVGLSAGGHDNTKLLSSVPDLPISLYKLVIAEEKWVAHTGKSLNNQAKNRTVSAATSTANSPYTGSSNVNIPMDNSTNSPLGSSSNNNNSSSLLSPSSSSSSTFGNFFSSISRGNSPIGASLGLGKPEKIVNENLEILTRFVNISLENGYFFEDQDAEDAIKIIRDELDTSSDLQLRDRFRGPVLFQGPNKPVLDTFKSFVFSDKNTTARISSDGLFSYTNGWPKLDANLIDLFHSNFNPRIVATREKRINAMERVSRNLFNIIRFESERTSHCYNSKLRSVLKGEMTSDSRLTSEESCATIALVVDIISLSLTMLSLRTSKKYKPASDILQILGILSQVETLNLVNYMDLASWRSIFHACASAGGDMMRRIAFLSFDTLSSFVEADCLTSGEFMRAINSVKSHKFTKFNDDTLDNFFFLEEIGNTWYIQREALNENSNQDFDVGDRSSSSGSSSSSARRRSISTAQRMSLMSSVKSNPILKKALSASAFIEKLDLMRPDGRFSFIKPNKFCALLRPKQAVTNNSDSDSAKTELFNLLNSRYEKIYNLNISIAPKPTRSTVKSPMMNNNGNSSNSSESIRSPDNSGSSSDLWRSATNKMSNVIKAMSTSTTPAVSPAAIGISNNNNKNSSSNNSNNNNSSSSNIDSSNLSKVIETANKVKVLYKPTLRKTKFGLGLNIFFDETTGVTRVNHFKELPENTPHPCFICDPPLKLDDAIIGVNDAAVTEYQDIVDSIKQSVDTVVIWIERWEERDFSDCESDEDEQPEGSNSDVKTERENESTPTAVASNSSNSSSTERGDVSDLLDLVQGDSNIAVSEEVSTSNILDFDDYNITAVASSAATSDNKNDDNDSNIIDDHNDSNSNNSAPEDPSKSIDAKESSGGYAVTNDSINLVEIATDSSLTTSAAVVEVTAAGNKDTSKRLLTHEDAKPVNTSDTTSPISVNGLHTATTTSTTTSATTTTSARSEFDDLIAWQKKIQDLQCGDKCKYAFGLSSRTVCACGFAMLDEEILAAWCKLPPNKITSEFQNVVNMGILHNIHCLKCARTIVPQLHVSCYTLDDTFDSVSSVWSEDVTYLSPYGLRFELESTLEELGADTVEAEKLYKFKPSLFWGLIWYTNRLTLPSGLAPSFNSSSETTLGNKSTTTAATTSGGGVSLVDDLDFSKLLDHPVVTSWRRDVSCIKARNVLRGSLEQNLSLTDLFPSSMQAALQQATAFIDDSEIILDSKAVFRDAFLVLGKAITEVTKTKTFDIYGSDACFERNLYLTMLTLCVVGNKQGLLAHKYDEDLILSLSAKIDFDTKYFNTVRYLSDDDLLNLNSTEKLLKDAIPGIGALAIRLGMGMML